MKWFRAIIILFGLTMLVACAGAPVANEAADLPQPSPTPAADSPPDVLPPGAMRQWAVSATASSEYADPEWAAVQATGAPDTPRCGDFQTAWAPVGSDTLEWIELQYTLPVYVIGVNIVQTFNPNQVAKVELVGSFGRTATIYEAEPMSIDQPCPYTLSITIPRTDIRYDTVRITLDQAALGLGWNEIDAVELLGEEE